MFLKLLAKGAIAQRFARKREDSVNKTKAKKSSSIMKELPQDQNLVGKGALPFTLEGKEHTIQFRDTNIILNGAHLFMLTAVGAGSAGDDVELSVKEANIANNKLTIIAGVWSKVYTMSVNEQELAAILTDLLRDRAVRSETADGTTVEISPKKF
jgi:hypothetical protein